LREDLLAQSGGTDLYRMMTEERPYLFADAPVFIPETSVKRQALIIAAVERVIAMPAYRERALAYAPETAHFVPKAQGVFFGYDFHVSADGPQLIEINSNAGGALLNVQLLRAQRRDVADGATLKIAGNQALEQTFWSMFLAEWQLERGDAPLRTIAIVDSDPERQFLYPEFVLCRNLFMTHGIEAVICDPAELSYRDRTLQYRGKRIDLVYNRLTDFGLQETRHYHLRDAYLAGDAIVTPHPRAHALYADKRNLAILTDAATLTKIQVDDATQTLLLEGIAHTVTVRPEAAESLWTQRKRLFFKPAAGYGGKAAYRGDKLTRRVFEEILHGDYVAQTLVQPSQRRLNLGDGTVELKLDLRNYAYRGEVQLLATRLYQGQTTNFRTPGGGFAPVVMLPCTN
jgi:hypothetical protein